MKKKLGKYELIRKLGDGATSPISSSIKYFRDEYIEHFTNGGCPFDPVRSTLFEGAGI